MAFFIVAKTVSTAISAFVLLKPVRLTTRATMSYLIIRLVFGYIAPPFAWSRIAIWPSRGPEVHLARGGDGG